MKSERFNSIGKQEVKIGNKKYLVRVLCNILDSYDDMEIERWVILDIIPKPNINTENKIIEYVDDTFYFDSFEWDNEKVNLI